MTETHKLKKEAVLFSRYLVGEDIPDDLVKRYIDANLILYSGKQPVDESAVLRFAVQFPISIAFLDGASAFKMKGGLLRGKILILISILEADTRYTRYFIPSEAPIPIFLAKGLFLGITGILRFQPNGQISASFYTSGRSITIAERG